MEVCITLVIWNLLQYIWSSGGTLRKTLRIPNTTFFRKMSLREFWINFRDIPTSAKPYFFPKKNSDTVTKTLKWKNNTQKRRVCSLVSVSVNVFFSSRKKCRVHHEKITWKKKGEKALGLWEFFTPRIHQNLRFLAVKWSSVRGVDPSKVLRTRMIYTPLKNDDCGLENPQRAFK